MKILIINGPNLNLLGVREPEIYGSRTFESYYTELCERFPEVQFCYFQSNSEGAIIDVLHSARYGEVAQRADAVILNAGAYTHYSYAIADAITAVKPMPVVEVHISQPAARESWRRTSVIAPVCKGSVSGFGLESYAMAVTGLCKK